MKVHRQIRNTRVQKNFYRNKSIGNLCGSVPYNLTINEITNIRDCRKEIVTEGTGPFVVMCDVETAATQFLAVHSC